MHRLLAAAAVGLVLAACARKAPPAPVIQGRAAQLQQEAATRPESVIVQPGETLYSIARRWDVPVRSLIEANGLQPPYGLIAGSRLTLPQLRFHKVQPEETLYSVSRHYGVDLTTLARTNRLDAPFTIRVGEMLIIPDPPAPLAQSMAPPTRPAFPTSPPVQSTVSRPAEPTRSSPPSVPPASASSPPLPGKRPEFDPPPPAVSERPPAPTPTRSVPEAKAPRPAGSSRERGFIWPVNGRIVSGFGPGPSGTHNDGINIAAPAGTPIRAVEDGVVAYVGNELRGFGNLILLKHSDGWMSAYAHCESTLVKKGGRVRRGQVIGRVGSSGAVAEPQLHFELRRGTRALDPVQHLPSTTAS